MQKYDLLEPIGQGQYGTAYKALHKGDGRLYCIKRIPMTAKDDHAGALKEAQLLSSLDHPNIISYKESFIDKDGSLCIVTSFCEEGDLHRRIRSHAQKGKFFTEEEIMDNFIQIASALRCIHTKKILHRDLKTQNIFIAKGGIIQLGDFGIAKVLEITGSFATTVTGTPYYMAPEICTNQPYTFKSDIWSLGCVLYELCTLKHAFAADSLLSLVYAIVRGNFPPIPRERYSQDLSDLVNSLLNKDTTQRPSLTQIFQMPYVQHHVQRYQTEERRRMLQTNNSLERRRMGPPSPGAQPQADAGNITPSQKLKMKKEQANRRRALELGVAAMNMQQEKQGVLERKTRMVQGMGTGLPGGVPSSRVSSRNPWDIETNSPPRSSTPRGSTPRSGTPLSGTPKGPPKGGPFALDESMVNMDTMPSNAHLGSSSMSPHQQQHYGSANMPSPSRPDSARNGNTQGFSNGSRAAALNQYVPQPQQQQQQGHYLTQDSVLMGSVVQPAGGFVDPYAATLPSQQRSHSQHQAMHSYDNDSPNMGTVNLPNGAPYHLQQTAGSTVLMGSVNMGQTAMGYNNMQQTAGSTVLMGSVNMGAGQHSMQQTAGSTVLMGSVNMGQQSGQGTRVMQQTMGSTVLMGSVNLGQTGMGPNGMGATSGAGSAVNYGTVQLPAPAILRDSQQPPTPQLWSQANGHGSLFNNTNTSQSSTSPSASLVLPASSTFLPANSTSLPSPTSPSMSTVLSPGPPVGGIRFGVQPEDRAASPYANPASPSSLDSSRIRFGVLTDSRPRGSFDNLIRNTRSQSDTTPTDSPKQATALRSVISGPTAEDGDDGAYDDEDFEDYEEDFEDYEEEEAGRQMVNTRLKILDQMEEMKHTTGSDGSIAQVQEQIGSTARATKAEGLRLKAREALGDYFKPVVDHLRKVRSADPSSVDEREVQKRLLELVGGDKSRLPGCFLVDQLIFQESMYT